MKKLTSKVIWLFAIGQLGWSILSALVTNWIITFYEPDTEMLKAGQTLFLPQGRVILGVFTVLGGIYALGRVFDAVTDPWIANLMRWGVCSTLSQIPGLRICRTGAGIRRAGGFHS